MTWRLCALKERIHNLINYANLEKNLGEPELGVKQHTRETSYDEFSTSTHNWNCSVDFKPFKPIYSGFPLKEV